MSDLDRQVRVKMTDAEMKANQLEALQAAGAELTEGTEGEVTVSVERVMIGGVLEREDVPAIFKITVSSPFATPDFMIPRYDMSGKFEEAVSYIQGLSVMLQILASMSGGYADTHEDWAEGES